jgi:hypothetical protein
MDMDCVGLDTLVHLRDVSIMYSSVISDNDMMFLKQIHHLELKGCPRIEGTGFHHLKQLKTLNLFELNLKKINLSALQRNNIDVFLSRCRMEEFTDASVPLEFTVYPTVPLEFTDLSVQ